MIKNIEKLLDDQIRPVLAGHGGGVNIIDFEDYKLSIEMFGGCQGCSSSQATLKDGIERLIKENFPEIVEVIDLTDHSSGENPYFK